MMTDDGVDMTDEMTGGANPALRGDEMVHSSTTTTTTADVGLDDGDLELNSTTVTSDLHHPSDSEEEKQEETEITTLDNRDATNNVDMRDKMMGDAYSDPLDEMVSVSSTVIVSVPRVSTATELHQNGNNSSNTNSDEPLVPPVGLTSNAGASNDSMNKGAHNIDPSQRPGAYAARGRPLGSRPTWTSDDLASPFDEQAEDVIEDNNPNLVVAAEISPPDTADLEAQFDERMKRQTSKIKKELKEELLQDVTAAEVVEERKEQPPSRRRGVWILVGLLAALLVGVFVGVGAALGKKDNYPRMNRTPAPTASPTMNPTPAPTASPTILYTRPTFTQLLNLIGNVTSDIEFLQNRTTPLQYAALDWLANVDTWEVDIDSIQEPQVFVERYVLALLFFSTNGTLWKNQNFLNSTSVCDWSGKDDDGNSKGVTCDGNDVSGLEMDYNGMQGKIPTELALLTSLYSMNFDANSLSGTIPLEIYSMTNLRSLWVEKNDLTGTLSTEIGKISNLASLHLNRNLLNGTLPTEIRMLTDLSRIALRENNIGGSLPAELGYLTALSYLDLGDNMLQGSIPTEFGALTALEKLVFENNGLEGQLPSELARLAALEYFLCHGNDLTGTLPTEIGTMSSLVELDLNHNALEGTLPTEIGMLTNLVEIGLYLNNIGGSLPTELGYLTALSYLDVGKNMLQGSIPTECGALTALESLYLEDNEFGGFLPSEIGLLTNLEDLWLHENNFNATVPFEYSDLQQLEDLRLEENNLTGSVDDVFCGSWDHARDYLSADCGASLPEISCSCCKECCEDLRGCTEVVQV